MLLENETKRWMKHRSQCKMKKTEFNKETKLLKKIKTKIIMEIKISICQIKTSVKASTTEWVLSKTES